RNRFDGFGFKLRRVTLGFSAHYWLLLMPFYFRKECPLNSGYLKLLRQRSDGKLLGNAEK
ncbi:MULTISPECIES: hypothetical protein, partial [Shigella]|uniref:hypothetical protein n=1 Tax=Shigella TaxID=620 RepID=UPI00194DCCCC